MKAPFQIKNRLLDPSWRPWWKQMTKFVLGGSLAATIKLIRLGSTAAWKACIQSFDACDLLENISSNGARMLLLIPEVKLVNLLSNKGIQQHWGATANWDFSLARGASFFFIDGSHTYAYVKNDSEKCLALCQGKGVFLWHDCETEHHGVLKFLVKWIKKGRNIIRIERQLLPT